MNVFSAILIFLILNISCHSIDESTAFVEEADETCVEQTDDNQRAKVISVSFTGQENNYNFSVGVSSPDEGCNQYADWWEIVSEDSTLIYRRILAHSHVNEQPFIRSGGPILITENQTVIIRAHMSTNGYGTTVYKGSVSDGFFSSEIASNFASNVSSQSPLPEGCAF